MSRAANLLHRMEGRALNGQYELSSLIGSGGFADVYRAFDRSTGGAVAVKILHQHMARDTEVVRRFSREARVARQIVDAHVVRILDTGEDDGLYFIVMEYVQGITLHKLAAQRGPLAPAEVVDLGCQALLGLAAAHDIGVIHRDVKPANLIVTSAGSCRSWTSASPSLPLETRRRGPVPHGHP